MAAWYLSLFCARSKLKQTHIEGNRSPFPSPILRHLNPMSAKPITSPVPEAWYPTLAVVMVSIGLLVTASFFVYEATSSRRSRSLAKELATGALASFFLGFGSLFLLLASGVYV